MAKRLPASYRKEAEALGDRYRNAVRRGMLDIVYPAIERDTQNLNARILEAGYDPAVVREIRSEKARELLQEESRL